MNLVSTSQTLRIVLGEAKTTNDCDITASYADAGASSFTLGANDLLSNGTTAVTVVAAPSSGQQRQIKEVHLQNNDTVSHTVTLQLHYGSTTRILKGPAVIPAGGEFVYAPGTGGGTASVTFEWNAGTVDVVGDGLSINGTNTLVAEWTAGDVSDIGAGLTSVAGTLSNTGILSLTGGTGVAISGGNTITNSGIVSLTGGTGITIAGGNTITNSGIVSLSGGTGITISSGNTVTNSGIVSLVAGSNVTISGSNTIAAASPGIGSIVAGSGISISGGNTVANSGIISLVGGTNVTISGSNTITVTDLWNAGTVTALASSQLTDSGGTLAIITGPTINVTPQTAPLILNGNTSTSFPTLVASTEFLIVGKDGNPVMGELIAVAGTVTGNGGNAGLTYGRMNGTLGSPSALGANDRINANNIRGYDGTTYASAVSVWNVFAGSTWTGSSHESYQTWSTVPSGATATSERVRLTSAGAVLIGTTAAVGSEKLRVVGDIVASGTATVGGIIINGGSAITGVGHALAINSGTLQDQTQGTITLSGTTTGTINPAGVDSIIVNVGTANGTIDISPGFQGQRLRIEIKMGATAHAISLVSPSFAFGTDITGYTATVTASARDIIQAFCMDGTHWGVGAIAHGFTI